MYGLCETGHNKTAQGRDEIVSVAIAFPDPRKIKKKRDVSSKHYHL